MLNNVALETVLHYAIFRVPKTVATHGSSSAVSTSRSSVYTHIEVPRNDRAYIKTLSRNDSKTVHKILTCTWLKFFCCLYKTECRYHRDNGMSMRLISKLRSRIHEVLYQRVLHNKSFKGLRHKFISET